MAFVVGPSTAPPPNRPVGRPQPWVVQLCVDGWRGARHPPGGWFEKAWMALHGVRHGPFPLDSIIHFSFCTGLTHTFSQLAMHFRDHQPSAPPQRGSVPLWSQGGRLGHAMGGIRALSPHCAHVATQEAFFFLPTEKLMPKLAHVFSVE